MNRVGVESVIDAFNAEMDETVEAKGKVWFDECWVTRNSMVSIHSVRTITHKIFSEGIGGNFKYKITVVAGSEHNYPMNLTYGAPEIWIETARAVFPFPTLEQGLNDIGFDSPPRPPAC